MCIFMFIRTQVNILSGIHLFISQYMKIVQGLKPMFVSKCMPSYRPYDIPEV